MVKPVQRDISLAIVAVARAQDARLDKDRPAQLFVARREVERVESVDEGMYTVEAINRGARTS